MTELDDGPAMSDPDHGVPGEAEPLPDGDEDVVVEVLPDEDDPTDDDPEEVEDGVEDDEGTPSEMDEDDV